ncbi:MFS transporter [Demequina zhanjiangensis]|uniref:MFS transporter n=1 Tax=Demequina zhanjiangensis TaxID=3051659 RepID=A0ABT8FZY4_9MICO|nr:MFS transporter [Demequina sp. SYSU T00b26]MDN4472451.1 MFS transporter [Demequina sp. SYSU T00b26]
MTALPPLAPSGVPRWRLPRSARSPHPAAVLAGFVVAGLGIGLSQAGASAVIQDQVRTLDTSVDMIGYTIMAYALGVVVGAPLLMVGLAGWGRRRLLLLMSGIFVVTSALTAIAPDVWSLLVVRFLAGLPHGALLGTASYVAMLAVGRERRGMAIATIMYGLTAATVVGVPAMQWGSEAFGWRWMYWAVTAVGVGGLLLIWAYTPRVAGTKGTSFTREMSTLTGRPLWMAILTITTGFAGLGAVQSYMVPLLEETNGFTSGAVTVTLVLFGVGMTIGATAGGRLTDRGPALAARVGLSGVVVSLALLGLFGDSGWPTVIFLVSLGAFVQVFSQSAQTRLMDVIHSSPSLGAALSHSALNAATVLGSGLGAVVIAFGFGFLAPAWLALVGAIAALVLVAWGPGYRDAE